MGRELRARFVDSHTEGEPTRVILSGVPDLGGGSVADQRRVFRDSFDWFRGAVVNEPRGSAAMVGACVVPSVLPGAVCGVVFFNNVGVLNACGHGTMGLAVTLARHGVLGRPALGLGRHVVETPVGGVAFEVLGGGEVEIENVASRVLAMDVALDVPWKGGTRRVRGDVAWGGNWFFLIEDHGLVVDLKNLAELTAFGVAVRGALGRAGVTGGDGAEIDHVELFGPASRGDCDSRNFVLCPGSEYDRSPCGTGTSAKMACLFAKGKLRAGQAWRQESVIGSRFVGQVRETPGGLIPTLRGRAFVTAEGELVLDDADPFVHGIR